MARLIARRAGFVAARGLKLHGPRCDICRMRERRPLLAGSGAMNAHMPGGLPLPGVDVMQVAVGRMRGRTAG